MAIRPDSDPKSATPPPGAPKGELEQYGVWVKAEPQDLVEEASSPGASDLDFEISDVSSPVPEESFLSEDEEKLLGSFDSEFESATTSSAENSGPLPDIEDMPPIEDSLLGSEPAPAMEEVADIGAGSIDISLEEIESVHPATSTIHPGVEIDMDSVEGLGATPHTAESAPTGTIEDVSSEFLDMGDESEPQPVSEASGLGSGLDDVTAEFLDVGEAVSAPKEAPPSADFEPLDIDLQFDDSIPSFSDEKGRGGEGNEAGFEAVTEFDDFLSPSGASPAPKVETPAEAFDDVSAVERDLSESPSEPLPEKESATVSREVTGGGTKPDLSTEILLKIADELSSIRGELVSLKSQIGGILSASEAGPAKPIADLEPPPPSGGFFDDEEDETIALTGDELDNILNTADFTEETAEAEEPLGLEMESLDQAIPLPESNDLLDETLLPESGDYSLPEAESPQSSAVEEKSELEPAIEEVRLGEEPSFEAIAVDDLNETGNLNLVAEEGVIPMTPAPEDSSYLEEVEPADLGAPLGDEPLVEPDLSAFDLDSEEPEPRLEIDEELPLASVEPELASVDDMTLDIEAGPGYEAEETVSEAELLEPVPELEETNFAEISLHEEELEPPSAIEPAELEEILPELEQSPATPLESQVSAKPATPVEEEEDLILGIDESPPSPNEFAASPAENPSDADGDRLRSEIKSVLSYLDKLLDSLPEEKIEEFARSEYFDTYKKLFEELGLV